MAPSRGSGFDGQLFFVYDREAVTKEGDPPEDAIIYFYPPSASIESRISICGQLVGVSNFLTTVLDFAPVLIKLRTEKVALLQSGKYTLAFGGSSTEPESLLLRQLNALFTVFAFYHGSFDHVQKFSKEPSSFLSNMTIIWDCYLPFIRYYGDTLPAVFDPLPFLKTPKASSGSFLKASHILQACQRRRHVLGGCILYKKSVLCTQLEPCITRRLLLFKPNQSHHPAKQVNTDIKLPFGVRILHAFLSTHEHNRLINELSRSPYHQNPSSQSNRSPASSEDEQEKEQTRLVGERFNGLLHRSVRKRIESESQGPSGARENRSKVKSCKVEKPRAKSERRGSSREKENPRSPLKRKPGLKKSKENEARSEINLGNSLRIDVSKHQDDLVTPGSVLKEPYLEQALQSSTKLVNELPLGKEKFEKDTDVNELNVSEEFSTNSLTKCQESPNLEDEATHPNSSIRVDTRDESQGTTNGASGSDNDELTMDEVDLKNLKIIFYEDSCNESGHLSENDSSTIKSRETVEDVCKKLVQDLIEQVVKLGNGQTLESNLQVDTRPAPSDLDLKGPINGAVCNFETVEGQHDGVLAIRRGENGVLNGEKLDPGTNLGRSTLRMQQNDQEGQRSVTHSALCGNPAGVLNTSPSEIANTDGNSISEECSIDCSSDVPFDECGGSPGSDYHDSLEDLVPDGGKSHEQFLAENRSDLLNDYENMKQNDFVVQKYSRRNINLPNDKNFEKPSFKDLVDRSTKTSSGSEAKTIDLKHGESNPETLDCGMNAGFKDSRTSSELSDTKSTDSLTRGCPGGCKSSLADSGFCLFHEMSDNVSHCETDGKSNPGSSQAHRGDGDVGDAPDVGTGANTFSNEEQVAEKTLHNNIDKDEEVDCHEDIDDNDFEVNGMVHLNLYVQAHSNTVLILLTEDQLHRDSETIKALWKTSLNELGELEVRLNQCRENADHSLKPEDYSYLVYDGLSNTTKGNLKEPVLQADHMFCDTAKTVHEQFNNCSSLTSVTLRNSSSAVHCQRSLGQEVYFHKKGSFKSFLSGSPSPRDPAFTLEKRASKLLHKDHGINVF